MNIYYIDTCSLFEMKNNYPMDVFVSPWKNIIQLIRESRLFAPEEVFKEIIKGDDELNKWVSRKKKLFIKPDQEQLTILAELLKKYPFLAHAQKCGPNADPWLIALALAKRTQPMTSMLNVQHIIVTEESKTKPNKIPAVCKDYHLQCITLIELFRIERWQF